MNASSLGSNPSQDAAQRVVRAQGVRKQGIDLIRGFAILLVILCHGWPFQFASAGIVGVAVFFALSGYLITGVLMRDLTGFGRVRFGRFYRNRAIRLLPALVAMLAVFALVEGTANILGDRDKIPRSILVGLTYTMNVPGFAHGSDALSHLWTLATEEQFYLVWPVALALCIRSGRPSVAVVSIAVLLLVMCAATIAVAFPEIYKVYTLPTSWASVMVIGALGRLWQDRIASLRDASRGMTYAATALALVFLIVLSVQNNIKDLPITYLAFAPAIAIATVILTFHVRDWVVLPHWSLRPLLWLGTISYAAYLWNYLIVMWLGSVPLSMGEAFASAVLTVVAATLSWFLVERPFNKLKARIDRPKQANRRAHAHEKG